MVVVLTRGVLTFHQHLTVTTSDKPLVHFTLLLLFDNLGLIYLYFMLNPIHDYWWSRVGKILFCWELMCASFITRNEHLLIRAFTVCCRMDEMIRNVESFEGKTHIHQVIIEYYILWHVFTSTYNYYLLYKTFCIISEHRYCYARSSRWNFKEIFGYFCLSDSVGKRAERFKRKSRRNYQNEGKCWTPCHDNVKMFNWLFWVVFSSFIWSGFYRKILNS